MSKRLSVPVCWQMYKMDDDVFAVLGQTASLPPSIILEMLVAEGKGKRGKLITTLQVEGITEHTHELDDEHDGHHPGLFMGDDGEGDDE